MLVKKSILKELRFQAGLIFCALFTIVLTMALVRLLGNAASGATPPNIVLPLILFSTFSSIGTTLSLSAFLAVFITFSRLQSDNELIILRTSGVKIVDFFPIILSFLIPLVIFTAITTLLATPWARNQADQLRFQAKSEESLKKYSAGKFSQFSNGEQVVFFERTEKESTKLGLVFVKLSKNSKNETIVLGSNGEIQFKKDEPWVILKNGSRVDITSDKDTTNYKLTLFQTYQMLLNTAPKNYTLEKRVKSTNTLKLLQRFSLADQGELLVRIGTVLLCLFLPFIALPLSLRGEKSLKILHVFTAVLIFLAANHFLGIFQALIIKGFINLFFSLFLIPIIIITLASFLIFNNENK